ncbi:unnamed protein product [Eretmochelys imbricata]
MAAAGAGGGGRDQGDLPPGRGGDPLPGEDPGARRAHHAGPRQGGAEPARRQVLLQEHGPGLRGCQGGDFRRQCEAALFQRESRLLAGVFGDPPARAGADSRRDPTGALAPAAPPCPRCRPVERTSGIGDSRPPSFQ